MAKGVLRGAVWGVVLGGAGIVSASLIAPQPAGNTPPERPQVQVSAASELETPDVATPEPIMTVDNTQITDAPKVAAPLQNVTAPIADSTPLEVPQTPDIGVTLALPEAPDVPELVLADEQPVLPNPQSLAPQVPVNEGDLVVETTPAMPVVVEPEPEEILVVETPPAVEAEVAEVPAVAEEIVESAPELVETVETPEVVAAETSEIAPPIAAAVDPVAGSEASEAIASSVTDAEDVAAVQVEVSQAPEPVEEIAMAEPPEDALVSTIDLADEPPVETPVIPTPEVVEALPEAEPEEPTADAPQANVETPQVPVTVMIIDTPTSALPQGNGGVKINRVIGSQQAEVVTEEPAPELENQNGPPLEVYAADFENIDEKPVMALILLDDPDFVEGPRAVADVPFAVTVLIDPAAPGATERMAAYRAEGVEIGVALRLPEGAQPVDVEVALEASFAALPEAVLLADIGGSDRNATAQILSALADQGRGFVSFSSGLSSGVRAANDAGVPAVEVYRDLDNEGQDARVIRRFLDQAAFRARQNSGVVVLGRMRADTFSAIILWGAANRAGQVAMAPVSTLLRGN